MSDITDAHRKCITCGLTGRYLDFEHVTGGSTFPLMRPVKCRACGHIGPPLDFPYVVPTPGPVARQRRSWRKDEVAS